MQEDGELSRAGRLISWVTTPRCFECPRYIRPKKRRHRKGKTRRTSPGHCSLSECAWKQKREGAPISPHVSRDELQ